MRNNTKGSTLVAAIAVIMIIMVILGASLTIASSYYKRSINENTQRQVYLTAKSSADVIAEYIIENEKKLIPEIVGDRITINSMEIDNVYNEISGYVLRVDEKTLKIVITATFDDYDYTIQTIMENKDFSWIKHSYCEAKAGDELC